MKKINLLIALLIATPICLFFFILLGPKDSNLIFNWHHEMAVPILQLRLYRIIAGYTVGAGLSCSGVVLQALLRNPLADPYVLGVSSGSALGAALVIFLGLSSVSIFFLPASAFLAGILIMGLVYLLACHEGTPSIYGLLLSGIIVGSVCSSLLMLIISLVPVEGMHSIAWWMLGNLQVMFSPLLVACSVLIVLGIVGIWCIAPQLNALTLGRDMAHHLGVRTTLIVSLGLVLATLTTAAAVAMAGLIGFIGLIVPHFVRNLIGPDHRWLVPVSALTGGLFLVLCDTFARIILAPVEIPVGVITALLGGPFFLILLRQRRKQGWFE